MGLDLQVERNENGLIWNDALRRVSLNYEFYPNVNLASLFNALIDKKTTVEAKTIIKF